MQGKYSGLAKVGDPEVDRQATVVCQPFIHPVRSTVFISPAATAVRALTCSRLLRLLHLYSRNPLISCLSISRQKPSIPCSPVCSRHGSKLYRRSLLQLPHTEGKAYSDREYASTSHDRQALRQIVFVSGDIRNLSRIQNTLNTIVFSVFL